MNLKIIFFCVGLFLSSICFLNSAVVENAKSFENDFRIEIDPDSQYREEVISYIDELFKRSEKWESDTKADDIYDLSKAKLLLLSGKFRAAKNIYQTVYNRSFNTKFGAEAIFGEMLAKSGLHSFDDAFDCVLKLKKEFPDYDKLNLVFIKAYDIANAVADGERPYIFNGLIPAPLSKKDAISYYETIYSYYYYNTNFSPIILYKKGCLALEVSNDFFSVDERLTAIDAFERIISLYPDFKDLPNVYLKLGAAYEKEIRGPNYDQGQTQNAINCYTDFMELFPTHKDIEYVYSRIVALREMLAENRLFLGDFYYQEHNNPAAAAVFYNEARTISPSSNIVEKTDKALARIKAGEKAERSFVDWLFGRYYSRQVKYLSVESENEMSLDQMGFGEIENNKVPQKTNDTEFNSGI